MVHCEVLKSVIYHGIWKLHLRNEHSKIIIIIPALFKTLVTWTYTLF